MLDNDEGTFRNEANIIGDEGETLIIGLLQCLLKIIVVANPLQEV